MTENIFDLTDVSDIPEEISAELSNDVFAQKHFNTVQQSRT